MRDLLPLLAFLAGASVGIFYGTTFTLWLTKQRREHNRDYVSRADTSAAVHRQSAETPTHAAPPPGEEDWIYELEYRVVTGK